MYLIFLNLKSQLEDFHGSQFTGLKDIPEIQFITPDNFHEIYHSLNQPSEEFELTANTL